MTRLFFALLLCSSLSAEVTAFYLSWYNDPTTTMTIQWLAPQEEALFVEIDGKWQQAESTHHFLDSLYVHAAHLDHLTPDTEYRFRFKEAIYKFRTAPTTLPLRFCIGGDAYLSKKLFRRMNQTIVAQDPLFAVIGGDIAYAIHPNPFRLLRTPFNRWVSFLKHYSEQMITSDGRVIPFLLVPGNHDIAPDNYELFFSLFAFPQKQLYRRVDFNNYLSLLLLDTGHFQPIEGQQTLWLKKALSSDPLYRFAIYHVAAYPSYYSYDDPRSQAIRTHWCPLFEDYGLSSAFEHHNHAYKRTYPLKHNQVDRENGIIYFGDGSWGVPPRGAKERWYLEEKGRKNSVYLIELSSEQAQIDAIDLFGEIFDEVLRSPLRLLQSQAARR